MTEANGLSTTIVFSAIRDAACPAEVAVTSLIPRKPRLVP